MGNAKQFSLDLSSWADKLEKDVAPQFVRKVALDLLRGVVKKSPVKSGRFKANWMVGIGMADETTTESTVDDAVERGAIVLSKYNKLLQIHISNNLPYAAALEHGHSQQAPLGVAEISVAEIKAHLK